VRVAGFTATAALAPWVPTVTETETDLVSSRVGDYQYIPTIGALLDQLWVHSHASSRAVLRWESTNFVAPRSHIIEGVGIR
jgi:hypothetical protein